jgi:predicted HicB family RNase H-like nuclease
MNDHLMYNSYIGSVHFSAEDEIFFGKIEGIPDLITFEGASVSELQQAFQEAVEDYIELCHEVGKQPFKSYKGRLQIRIPSELHKKAAQKAFLQGVSLNQFVQHAIEKEII